MTETEGMSIHLSIKKIKNINSAELALPFDKGIYAIVGENSCGKSTIMLALSLMIKKSSAKLLSNRDITEYSEINIEVN